MNITTLSSREFNQDVSKAKRAATKGPVIITDRGEPSHVLLSIKEYQQISGQAESIVDLLMMDTDLDIEFDPPKLDKPLQHPADLS